MKQRNIFALITLLLIVISANKITAQTPTTPPEPIEITTPEMPTSKVILQPYIGGINMKKWAYDANYNQYQSSKGSVHYGLSGEFLISNRIGIGFDAIYTPFTRTEKQDYFINFDPITGEQITGTDEVVITENKIRLIPKVYIHFNVKDPTWDLYISGGIGLNIMVTELRVNGEKKDYGSYAFNGDFPIMNPAFPFAGRFCFGTRYNINDHFGINFEAGFGGPPFSFGLNFRF